MKKLLAGAGGLLLVLAAYVLFNVPVRAPRPSSAPIAIQTPAPTPEATPSPTSTPTPKPARCPYGTWWRDVIDLHRRADRSFAAGSLCDPETERLMEEHRRMTGKDWQ